MTNEEKILSMLDLVATQVTRLTETSVTKADLQHLRDELRGFKEQTNHRFGKVDERFDSIDERLDGIDMRFDQFEADNTAAHQAIVNRIDDIDKRFDQFEADNTAAHQAIINRIDAQSELLEARFDVLNERLFEQETQLKILKKKEAL